MRLPPEPILVAAKRWLELLAANGSKRRVLALLINHPSYGDLTPTQYATAYAWALEVGLLADRSASAPVANRILGAIFEKTPPSWVQDADELVQSPDELPADVVAAGAALGLDEMAVYGQLVTSWGKVDTAARERVGAAGEAALVAMLRESADARVDHVSTWSDGLGYDIAYADGSVSAHIEVKSTTRAGRLTVYLSRNEYSVMLRDERWVLIAVRLTPDFDIVGIGVLPKDWIAKNVPRDVGLPGSWATCKLEVPTDVIGDGVPQLGSKLAHKLRPW